MKLTFDAEPFWCTLPVRHARSDWDSYTDKSAIYCEIFFDFCSERGLKPTIFFVGKYAQIHPELVLDAVSRGFSIGSHSMWHEDLSVLDERSFVNDVLASKFTLEDISGTEIIRFRAPSFSIRPWQINILSELGFLIDSSVSRAARLYGGSNSGDFSLLEYDLRGIKVFGNVEMTVLGGGYFRLLPATVLKVLPPDLLGNMIYLHPHDLFFEDEGFNNMGYLQKLMRSIKIGKTLGKLDILHRRVFLEGLN